MEPAALFCRFGLRVLRMAAALLLTVLLLYGCYSLWDTAMLYRNAFAGNALLQYKPPSAEAAAPTLAELQALNPDVCGWLSVDNTHIDYPLLQGKDDFIYLNRDVYGDFALSGSIFLDSRNAPACTDSYTLLYGHHMDNGAMFGDITRFCGADYFTGHTGGTLYLPQASYTISFFACVRCDATDPVLYTPGMQDAPAMDRLLTAIGSKAVQYRSIDVKPGDSIIGLSTCDEDETNGRIVLFGRLTPVEAP